MPPSDEISNSHPAARRPPAVSVIICVYNGVAFLRETLASVCRQTMADFEILAVDDGSTDGSRELLLAYPDPRLTVLDHPHGGAVRALNAGLSAARGRYIGILDQDDLWLPGKLEAHCSVLDAEADVDLTFSWYAIIDEDSKPIGLCSPRSRGRFEFAALLEDYVIGPNCSAIVRREALIQAGPADPSFPRLYDFDLFLGTALLRPRNVAAIPAELTLYRRHGNQLSADWEAMREEWDRVVEKFRHAAPEAVQTVAGRAEANMNRYHAMVAYECGDYRSAAALVWTALTNSPLAFARDPRNWRATAATCAGLILPRFLHRRLERLAGLRRSM